MKTELDLSQEELKQLELLEYNKNIINGIDINKLTRKQKRHILKNDKYSDTVRKTLMKK